MNALCSICLERAAVRGLGGACAPCHGEAQDVIAERERRIEWPRVARVAECRCEDVCACDIRVLLKSMMMSGGAR